MIKLIYRGWFIIIIMIMTGTVSAGEAINPETGLPITVELLRQLPIEKIGSYGTVDGISEDAIWIDDKKYMFSSNATFLSKDVRATSRSSFKKGNAVGFILNSDGEIAFLQKIKLK